MATVGSFASGQVLYAEELNRPFTMAVYRSTTVQAITTATQTTVTYAAGDIVTDLVPLKSTTFPARFYPDVNGYYVLDTTVQFSANAGTSAYVCFTKNGTIVAQSAGDLSGTGANSALSCSHVIYLVVGDYVDSVVFQNSGGSINITAKTISVVRFSGA